MDTQKLAELKQIIGSAREKREAKDALWSAAIALAEAASVTEMLKELDVLDSEVRKALDLA